MKLLFKLLKYNINIWQIIGFVIANLLGGIIVLTGLRAYRDIDSLLSVENGLISGGYISISKPISTFTLVGNMMGIQPVFTTEEIKELEQHPSVDRVAAFTAANFQIRGGFKLGDLNISTDLFMESVPDDFLDVDFDDSDIWRADVKGDFIPVVIPRKYLNIYNYGYAATKGLPQLGEGLTSSFPITMVLKGNGVSRTYSSKIVGFTDRLNTILVPDGFLKEANLFFTGEQGGAPSRLIIATDSNGDEAELLEFIDSKNYAVEGDIDNLRLQSFVHGVLYVVIGVGVLISFLAFFLLMVSILLLIEKNREKFINLHSLGFTHSEMAIPYISLVVVADILVWVVAATVVHIAYPAVFAFASVISPDFELSSPFVVWVAMLLFALLFIILHRYTIRRELRRIVTPVSRV
ncbi:MAG: hypothetical protein IJ319_00905 [Bacteroidaceae bacterium]|nr:hypothetical protein [Bacteroidaceae bacterium]